MEKSVERSFQDEHGPHGGKDDYWKNKKRSVVASSKVGPARCSNRDKLAGLGHRLDKSQKQSNTTQVSKFHQVPVMKTKFQKPAGAGPAMKNPSVYNLRSKNLISEGAPSCNLRYKDQKTEKQKASITTTTTTIITRNASINVQNRKPPKKDSSKDSSVAMQKGEVSKNSTKPIKRIETPKRLPTSLAAPHKKNHPLTSQHELFLREPVYHIRWEGADVENQPLGHHCVLCNKDLSRATEDDDEYDSEYSNDDFRYDDDEYDPNPLLPAVAILWCGHAYHNGCLQKDTPKEQLSDPQCILCHKMT